MIKDEATRTARIYDLVFVLICGFTVVLVALIVVYIWHVVSAGIIVEVVEKMTAFAFGVAVTLAVENLHARANN